jgi:hypothetical protein
MGNDLDTSSLNLSQNMSKDSINKRAVLRSVVEKLIRKGEYIIYLPNLSDKSKRF